MNIQPNCGGCGKPYAEAKAIHPNEEHPENWVCDECSEENAQVHQFDPDAKQVIEGRESMTNGEYAKRGATTVCNYSAVCNPDDNNIADLITALGHFSDREGHNFRAILRRAIRNWEAER